MVWKKNEVDVEGEDVKVERGLQWQQLKQLLQQQQQHWHRQQRQLARG